MAYLVKRGKKWSIVFSTRENGKSRRKVVATGSKVKKEAESKLLEYEKLVMTGDYDPFVDPIPKSTNRSALRGKEQKLKAVSELFLDSRSQCGNVAKGNYRRHLNLLIKQVGGSFPVSRLTTDDIRSFCFKSANKPATQKSYLTHIRQFCKWLHLEGYQKSDISQNLRPPKVTDNVHEKTISQEQLRAIHRAHREDMRVKRQKKFVSHPSQMQNWFRPVTTIAFYQGLRVREIVALTWSDIDFTARKILIRNSKNHLGREIPMTNEANSMLRKWFRAQNYPKNGLVFPSMKSVNNQVMLSKGNISRVFKRTCRLVGLPETINFHGLRHSCGTLLHNLGFDVIYIGKFLGNGRGATEKYVHSGFNELQQMIEKSNL